MNVQEIFYSPSTKGFYCVELNGEDIPEDSVLISAELHASLQGKSVITGPDGLPMEAPAAPAAVPQSVSMRQAQRALLSAGKLAGVATAIAALQSPQREIAQVEWATASVVERNSPIVSMLAAPLGLSEAALDALFITAATL